MAASRRCGRQQPWIPFSAILVRHCLMRKDLNNTGNEKLRCRVPVPAWILLCGRCGLMFAAPPTHCAQQWVAVRRSNVIRIADHTNNPPVQGAAPATPAPAHVTMLTHCTCNFDGRCSSCLVPSTRPFSTNGKRLILSSCSS
jgi:hypothetical protein